MRGAAALGACVRAFFETPNIVVGKLREKEVELKEGSRGRSVLVLSKRSVFSMSLGQGVLISRGKREKRRCRSLGG